LTFMVKGFFFVRMKLTRHWTSMSTANKLLWLFTIAFLARLTAMLLFRALDRTFEYQLIAQHVLSGDGLSWDEWGRFTLQPTSLFVPLYVYWCAFFQAIFGDNSLPMYVGQCIIAASGVYPIYRIASAWWSIETGLLAGVAYAIYPEMIFLPQRAVPEFGYVVLVLWMLWAYVKLQQGRVKEIKLSDVVKLAAVSTIAILTKEGAVVVAIAIGLMLIWKQRPLQLALSRVFVPLFVIGVLLFSPWWIRNYNVQNEFIFLRTGMGMNLFMGNHDQATGTDKTMNGDYQLNVRWREFGENTSRTIPDDEQDRDRFYGETAKSWIKSHPSEYLELCFKRLKYYLWFDPTHYLAMNIVYRLSYIFLLMLAVPGLFLLLKSKNLDGVIILSILGFLALYVPTIVLPRYRIILVLFLLMFAGYFVRHLVFLVSTRWQRIFPKFG